jgi:hypothetical protein
VAPHARVAAALRSAGVSTVLVAPGGDGALAAALGAHFAAAPAGAGR